MVHGVDEAVRSQLFRFLELFEADFHLLGPTSPFSLDEHSFVEVRCELAVYDVLRLLGHEVDHASGHSLILQNLGLQVRNVL